METEVWRNTLDIRKPSQLRRQSIGERRLSRYRKRGLFVDADRSTEVEYVRAISADELRAAYHLVHDVFVAMDYILPRKSELRIRPFETSAETATFVAKFQGRIVGTISLIVDSDDLGLPSDGPFADELGLLRQKGRLLCEITNQAIIEPFRQTSICTELMRSVWMHAWILGCTDMICSISPNQQKFYEFIGFEKIGDKRPYSDETEDIVINMHWDLIEQMRRWEKFDTRDNSIEAFWKNYWLIGNPYISYIHHWSQSAKKTFADPDEMLSLFGECRELFESASSAELEAMRKRLGASFERVYDHVLNRGQARQSRVDDLEIFYRTPIRVSEKSRPIVNKVNDHIFFHRLNMRIQRGLSYYNKRKVTTQLNKKQMLTQFNPERLLTYPSTKM